jgi:hypothetical protein
MNVRRAASLMGVLVIASAAAAADLAQTVHGKWKADMVATLKQSAMYKNMPEGAQKKMLDDMANAPAFVFEFTDKTIVTTNGEAAPETATYKVVKTAGKVLTIQVTSKKKDGTDHTEDTDIELLGADAIKLSNKSDDMVLFLNRVK